MVMQCMLQKLSSYIFIASTITFKRYLPDIQANLYELYNEILKM